MKDAVDKQVIDWVSSLVLGAANAIPTPTRPVSQGVITGPSGNPYEVVMELGRTKVANLYQCILPTSEFGMLKIAADVANNGNLDKEALALKMIAEEAAIVEAKNPSKKRPYNFQFFVPQLVESFVCKSQGGRRVNVFAFSTEIEDVGQLVPLSSLIEKEMVRVDPRTSVWIMGKWLKILAFAHSLGIANGQNDGSNALLERNEHGVILFDWTNATLYDEAVPANVAKSEIAQAAKSVIKALGGNPEKGELPESDQLVDDRYEKLLLKLAKGTVSNADEAYDLFYELAFELWPRQFHPFTTYPV